MVFGEKVASPTVALLNILSSVSIPSGAETARTLGRTKPGTFVMGHKLMKFMGADFEMTTKS